MNKEVTILVNETEARDLGEPSEPLPLRVLTLIMAMTELGYLVIDFGEHDGKYCELMFSHEPENMSHEDIYRANMTFILNGGYS